MSDRPSAHSVMDAPPYWSAARSTGADRTDSPWIERVVWAALGVVLAAALAQSAIGEQYLGVRSGIYLATDAIDPANLPAWLTWAYPVSVIGLTVVSGGVAYLLRHAERAHIRRYPWVVALGAGSLSFAANFLHGPLVLGLGWPWPAAGAWSAVPTASFLAGFHLVYVLRRSRERSALPALRFIRATGRTRAATELPPEPAAERPPERAVERPSPRRRSALARRLPAPRTHVPRLLAEIAAERGIDPAQVEAGDVAERLGYRREHSSVRRWVSAAKAATFRPESGGTGQEVAA